MLQITWPCDRPAVNGIWMVIGTFNRVVNTPLAVQQCFTNEHTTRRLSRPWDRPQMTYILWYVIRQLCSQENLKDNSFLIILCVHILGSIIVSPLHKLWFHSKYAEEKSKNSFIFSAIRPTVHNNPSRKLTEFFVNAPEPGELENTETEFFDDDNDTLTNWRQFFMRLSCYWSWISS